MKKKRNQKGMISVLLAMVILGIFLISGMMTYAVSSGRLPLHAKKAEIAEAHALEVSSNSASSAENETSTPETSASTTETSSAEEAVETKDPAQLAPGKNHNDAASEYAYSTAEVRGIINGEISYEGPRVCFLTFDDGANGVITPKILDILKAESVPATFFVVGKEVGEAMRPVLTREIQEGNAIGIHSFNHDYGLLYPNGTANPGQIKKEAIQTQTALKTLFGDDFQTNVWRYPGGHMSFSNMKAADAALAESGMEWIDWDAMTGDAEPASRRPKNAQEAVAFQEKSMAVYPDNQMRVVLMHDAEDKNITVEALPQIIEFYRQNGYTFGVLE
ncbi:polysaccharide deacetylase family protein [Enterococcus hirae]|nr:polysaccharide deacetylase family protein [Enterococcus hirae]